MKRVSVLLLLLLAPQADAAASAVQAPGTRLSVPEQADLVIRCWNAKAMPPGLTDSQRRMVSGVIRDLRDGRTERAESTWQNLYKTHVSANPQALTEYVLKAAYREQLDRMFPYADRVRFSKEAGESVNVHLSRAKALRSAPRSMGGNEMEVYVARLEKQRSEFNARLQEDQLAFQNADQKYNQFMNLLISVLKTMNELRSGIAKNLK